MSISDDLRDAIRQSGQSVNSLAKECKVPQPMLSRFLNGQDIRLATAEKVADYFGFRLVRPDPVKKTAMKKRRPTA